MYIPLTPRPFDSTVGNSSTITYVRVQSLVWVYYGLDSEGTIKSRFDSRLDYLVDYS